MRPPTIPDRGRGQLDLRGRHLRPCRVAERVPPHSELAGGRAAFSFGTTCRSVLRLSRCFEFSRVSWASIHSPTSRQLFLNMAWTSRPVNTRPAGPSSTISSWSSRPLTRAPYFYVAPIAAPATHPVKYAGANIVWVWASPKSYP